ncbi:hypothetical protein G6F68_012636 [Rhizopus microsporus]|nr:hypothetical protein G6F68_012636 [Rhizopus microsporus]
MRDRAQHVGDIGDAGLRAGHHAVEMLDHRLELVLERGGIAAHAEVPGARGAGQFIDLRVERHQALLHGGQGAGQRALLARVVRQVTAEVTDGVALHHLGHQQFHLHVRFDQAVGGLHHAAEITRERAGIHAIADRARLMLLGHLQLCADRGLHALPHTGHRLAQLGQFVTTAKPALLVQLALG